MFSPAISTSTRLRVSGVENSRMKSIVAPVGGWNARDALSEMKPEDAVYLDNVIPDTLGVRLRRGVTTHATGITGSFVETLMEYSSPGSNPKLFAAGPQAIFDVTAEATATSVVSSLSNGRWQHTMFNAGGGDYLVIANGADSVRNYDGSSWTTPAITNVTSSTLVGVHSHMSRLWFIENASLSVWYLPALSVAGAATEFDLGGVSKNGGYLMAMGSWSRDGGEGLDDVAVFITSGGEAHIYAGTDPDDAPTSWGRIGTFSVPKPVGRRCLIKLGADLLYLSEQGVLSLPQFLAQNSAGVSKTAVTDKISGAFKSAYRDNADLFGWQILEYHKENLLICNVPIRERNTQHQYVMNLKTGAWCRFKDIQAGCWGKKGNDLYCGGNDGKVRVYGSGTAYDDDGTAITALGVQAFNDFGTPKQKRVTMVRPWVRAPQDYVPQVKLLVDFDESLPTFDPIAFEEIGPEWDVAEWDVAEWGASSDSTAYWQSVTGTSVVGAPAVAAALTAAFVWNRTDVLYEPGGVL
jgi:hypothetical protein